MSNAPRNIRSWMPGLLGVVELQANGVTTAPARSTINFVGQTTFEDDPDNDRLNVTLAASGGRVAVATGDVDLTEVAATYSRDAISFTGALTAMRTRKFLLPSDDDHYYERTISNDTTGGFNLAITCGTGLNVVLLGMGQSARIAFSTTGARVVDSPRYGFTTPNPAASWTAYNGAASTLKDAAGGVTITSPSQSSNHAWTGIEEAHPATYTIEAELVFAMTPAANSTVGLFVRDSATGHFLTFGIGYPGAGAAPQFLVQYWNDAATYAGTTALTVATPPIGSRIRLRIQNDGTNLIFSYLADGETAVEIYRQAKASFVPGGGDRVGVVVDGYGGDVAINLQSWKVGT